MQSWHISLQILLQNSDMLRHAEYVTSFWYSSLMNLCPTFLDFLTPCPLRAQLIYTLSITSRTTCNECSLESGVDDLPPFFPLLFNFESASHATCYNAVIKDLKCIHNQTNGMAQFIQLLTFVDLSFHVCQWNCFIFTSMVTIIIEIDKNIKFSIFGTRLAGDVTYYLIKWHQ